MLRNCLSALIIAALAAVGFNLPAQAQSACPIFSEAPIDLTTTPYTLSASDGCTFLNFTSASAETVVLPLPNTAPVPAGFKVFIKAQGAGTVTISPSAAAVLLDGASTTVAVTQGTGGYLFSANNKWYWQGLGIKHP